MNVVLEIFVVGSVVKYRNICGYFDVMIFTFLSPSENVTLNDKILGLFMTVKLLFLAQNGFHVFLSKNEKINFSEFFVNFFGVR